VGAGGGGAGGGGGYMPVDVFDVTDHPVTDRVEHVRAGFAFAWAGQQQRPAGPAGG
jgi:hypothetical protein